VSFVLFCGEKKAGVQKKIADPKKVKNLAQSLRQEGKRFHLKIEGAGFLKIEIKKKRND